MKNITKLHLFKLKSMSFPFLECSRIGVFKMHYVFYVHSTLFFIFKNPLLSAYQDIQKEFHF